MPCSAASHAEVNQLWEHLNIPSGCNVSQSIIAVSDKFSMIDHCICCSLHNPIHVTSSLEMVVMDCLSYLVEVRNPKGRARGRLQKGPKNGIHVAYFPLLSSIDKEGGFKFSKGPLLPLSHFNGELLDNTKVNKNWPAGLLWIWD